MYPPNDQLSKVLPVVSAALADLWTNNLRTLIITNIFSSLYTITIHQKTLKQISIKRKSSYRKTDIKKILLAKITKKMILFFQRQKNINRERRIYFIDPSKRYIIFGQLTEISNRPQAYGHRR